MNNQGDLYLLYAFFGLYSYGTSYETYGFPTRTGDNTWLPCRDVESGVGGRRP